MIERQIRILSIFKIRTEELLPEAVHCDERTWHDWDGDGRWRYTYFKVSKDGKTLTITSSENTAYSGSKDVYVADEINKAGIREGGSCLGTLVGYNVRYVYRA